MAVFQEKVLLVKWFYQNQENSVAAVRKFRCVKKILRGPMSPRAPRKMIQKFEATGQFDIPSGRGKKQILSSSVENVATAVIEASRQSMHGNMSVLVVFHVLDMPYSMI